MSRKFQCKTIPSKWLEKDGRRLDCGPYMSGALEARELIKHLHTEPLNSLTDGYKEGIYNGSPFVRNYVNDPEHGVRFLTTSSMLQSDLSNIPLLSKKDATSNKLHFLEIKQKMILITCSGSIGRMAYARKDMEGTWSNQDILKVVADDNKIKSGYLYAYLSSCFGIPIVLSGTYGAIIQHIEPSHIADLPVPRLRAIENHVHELIQKSADMLSEYQRLLSEATEKIFLLSKVSNPSSFEWFSNKKDLGFIISSCKLGNSLRAWNHSSRAMKIFNEIKKKKYSLLGELIDDEWLRWRVMFKRIFAEPEYGIEVITQKPLFNLKPKGKWISKSYLLNHSDKYVVPDETILIAKQGTLGEKELYCRCEFITGEKALNRAYSDHCMRVVVKEESIHPGYLYAFLRSNVGFRLLRSLSEGSKQQDLHWRTVPKIPIPRLELKEENKIGEMVRLAYKLRNDAVELDDQARTLVEEAIKTGGS